MLMLLILSLCIGIPILNTPSFSISLTDGLVVLLLPVVLFRIWSNGIKMRLALPDWGIIVFVLALSISLIFHFPQGMFLSVLGLTRVVLFYVLVKFLIHLTGVSVLNIFHKAFSGIIVLTAGTGLAGMILFAAGIPNPFILVREYYYGLVPVQWSGLDGHPNGAALLIFVSALIVFYTRPDKTKWPTVILLISLLGLMFTQVKSNLLYFAVAVSVSLAWSDSSRLKLRLGYALSVVLILAYLLISHWFPVRNQDLEAHKDQIPIYLDTSDIALQGKTYTIYPTHYTTNKRAAWTCFRSYPWTGIGPRKYLSYVDSLQRAGAYPAACRFKSPHCMYTGILAKFGWTGFLGLIVLIISVFITLINRPASGLRVLFSGLFTVMFFDGWTADMEYSKAMWFLIAWLAADRNVNFYNLSLEKTNHLIHDRK